MNQCIGLTHNVTIMAVALSAQLLRFLAVTTLRFGRIRYALLPSVTVLPQLLRFMLSSRDALSWLLCFLYHYVFLFSAKAVTLCHRRYALVTTFAVLPPCHDCCTLSPTLHFLLLFSPTLHHVVTVPLVGTATTRFVTLG